MAVQYKDDTFGEILPLNEAIEEFNKAVAVDKAKALHVGTVEEIEEAKKKVNIEIRVEELEKRVADHFSQREQLMNSLIELPTAQEIKNLIKEAQ